jgi:hypothetical protein
LGEGNHVPTLGKSEAQPFCQMTGKNSPSPWGEGRDEGGQFQTIITPPTEVREQFKRVKPLAEIGVKERSWTLDVLNLVHRLVAEKRQRTGAQSRTLRVRRASSNRAPASWTAVALHRFPSAKGMNFPTRKFTPLPRNWKNCIRAIAISKIKSASSFKSCAMQGFLIQPARGVWQLK